MFNPKSQIRKVTVKAKAIDQKKDKILYAGIALLAGLIAIIAMSATASAKVMNTWNSQVPSELRH